MSEVGHPVIQAIDEVEERDISKNPGHEHDQGWTRRLISLAINGSPDLIATVIRLAPHEYHPPHSHPNTGSIYFVLSGRCEAQVGDRIEMVKAMTAIYTPRGVPHALKTFDEGVEVLIIYPMGDLTQVQKEWVQDPASR